MIAPPIHNSLLLHTQENEKKVRTMFDPSTSTSINFVYILMYLLGVKRQYVTDNFMLPMNTSFTS